ncbi:hypothetical protein [Soonwooa sp.]|uniref:hypothetical protein n=1 Tax=Soonwooa sp. TaxID=1938592 RepID=UPI0028A9C797|nr:hypothetical protein [Soonwooa sp.]
MKDNPFITIFLLICIEIGALYYLDYIDSSFLKKDGAFVLMVLTIPVISIGLSAKLDNNRYQKNFKRFNIFLIIVAVTAFFILSYLNALGHAYQH